MKPTLYVHDRRARQHPIAEREAEALIACFGSDGEATAEMMECAAGILSALREREEWVACDCRGESIEPPPLMSPRLRCGQIHVWRHGATPHDPECPLWIESEAKEDQEGAPDGPWRKSMLLLRPAQAQSRSRARKVSPAPDTTPGQSEDDAARPLTRILWTLLTRAGYTLITAGDIRTFRDRPAISAQANAYTALERLREIEVVPGLHWGAVTCTYLPALEQHCRRLSEIAAQFPAGVRPQGYFLGVVDAIESSGRLGHALVWQAHADTPVRACVHGQIYREPRATGTAGPFWVLAQVAQRPGQEHFELLDAAVQPCVSRSVLIPVRDAQERVTAEVLMRQLTYWAKTLAITPQLERPLFPEAHPQTGSVSVDLNLWIAPNKRIVVMGRGRTYTKDIRAVLKSLPGVVATLGHGPSDDTQAFSRRLTAITARQAREMAAARPRD